MPPKLPPIFASMRPKIGRENVPTVVIDFRSYEWPDLNDLSDTGDDTGNVPLSYLDHYWMEHKGLAFWAQMPPIDKATVQGYMGIPYNMKVTAFTPGHSDGERETLYPAMMAQQMNTPDKDSLTNRQRTLLAGYIKLSALLHRKIEEERRHREQFPTVTTGVRLLSQTTYERKGDTVIYRPVTSLAEKVRDMMEIYTRPRDPSGIRKREHGVRGHWRTYKSGKRVWVREHRRGDPDLGTVTPVLR